MIRIFRPRFPLLFLYLIFQTGHRNFKFSFDKNNLTG